ncbi:MAG: hypothetical protein NDI88_11720 [Lysobacter sp.]|nr:hypothetical protein [Lysobacter sp.]
MWTSNGAVNPGDAAIEGDAIRFPQPRVEGRPRMRTSGTRQGADAFKAVRERREGEGRKEVLVVDYRWVPR